MEQQNKVLIQIQLMVQNQKQIQILVGIFGIWNGNEEINPDLRFMITDTGITTSISFNNTPDKIHFSPFSRKESQELGTAAMAHVLDFPCFGRNGELHYFVYSIDCSETYNSSTTTELEGYEGDFYSLKVFVDGSFLYDTYYSIYQYDQLKEYQNNPDPKYFIIGRCSGGWAGYWHYSKMQTYCMRLYNRGLSEEEIIDNYNTTKAYYSAVIGN